MSGPTKLSLTGRAYVPAPSLHGRYPLLRYYGPVRLPHRAAPRVMSFPRVVGEFASPPCRVSQVPRPICPYAPSPLTPESPAGAHPLLPGGYQASSNPADWPLSIGVTRPNRVHLRYGSQVRRARLRQPDCSGPRSLGYLLNGQLTDQTPCSLIDRPDLSWRTGLHRL